MISRMIFCSAQASLILSRRFGRFPSTSSNRRRFVADDVEDSFAESGHEFFRVNRPMPLTMPLPRYFSIPRAWWWACW